MEISTIKTMVTDFAAEIPVSSKIIICDAKTEQTSHFQYLKYCSTYDNGNNIDNKIAKYNSVCDSI